MENLIQEKAVEFNKTNCIISTDVLKDCQTFDDYLTIGAPMKSLCFNLPYFDELTTKEKLIMKIASVIGD